MLDEARIVHGLLCRHAYSFHGIPGFPSPAALLAALKEAEADLASKPTRKRGSKVDLVRESRAVITELRRALTFHAQTSADETLREQLAQVRRNDDLQGGSHARLAAQLGAWALLGEQQRRAIDGLGGFDLKTIARARELSELLIGTNPRQEAKDATAERRMKLAALVELVRKVRLAARFVFRDQPQIARLFTSEYERKRRARSRRKKKSEP